MQGSFLTRQAFAAECGISLRTLERWIEKGVVHVLQPLLGGTVMIPRSELERLEAEQLELARLRAEERRAKRQQADGDQRVEAAGGDAAPANGRRTRRAAAEAAAPQAPDLDAASLKDARPARAPLAPARAVRKRGEPWRPPFLDERDSHRRRRR